MNHPVELLAQSYLKDIISNKKKMDSETIETVVNDIRDALHRQFAGESRQEFRLRPSNLGRPKCQLWFDKNKPSQASELPSNFVINMFLGDVVEAIFKGILRAMKVDFKDTGNIDVDIDGQKITGEYDLILNDKVDDDINLLSHSQTNYKSLKDLPENVRKILFETKRTGLVGEIGALGIKRREGNFVKGFKGTAPGKKGLKDFKYVI